MTIFYDALNLFMTSDHEGEFKDTSYIETRGYLRETNEENYFCSYFVLASCYLFIYI